MSTEGSGASAAFGTEEEIVLKDRRPLLVAAVGQHKATAAQRAATRCMVRPRGCYIRLREELRACAPERVRRTHAKHMAACTI
mmetsp:Transcript_40245/g.85837  ORF Transcript_40245/g.85837 Transcript_40245/m.85837 type:complete len:83 (+) Transcript_40245:1095-1343(+)